MVRQLSTTNAIKLTEPGKHQVIQRIIGTTAGAVTITGSYSGTTIMAVQAQVVDSKDHQTVVPWYDIPVSLTRKTFSGKIIVPQGGWYYLSVRALNGNGEVLCRYDGTNPWGVGMNILCIGQSNMVGNGDIHNYHHVNMTNGLYCNDNYWKKCADPYDNMGHSTDIDYDDWVGVSMIPFLVNNLNRFFPGLPIGIVPAAKGATPLHGTDGNCWGYRDPDDHFSASTLYGNSITNARNAGGVELIIMHQGETDATNNVADNIYMHDLKTLLDRYREDIENPGLPLFICQLAGSHSTTKNRTDVTMQQIRNAQSASDNPPDIYLASLCIDVTVRSGDDHYTRAAYDTIGTRMANAIAYHYGVSAYYRGPKITGAQFTSPNRSSIDVMIRYSKGTDFTPSSGITGFQLIDDKTGATIPIISVIKHSSTTIRIDLPVTCPADGTVSLRYLYGKEPDITSPVKDNTPLRLPLEPATVPVIEGRPGP